ncbi:hypothetical protein JKF63_07904 [Porcisia hertigi]|uniref:Uncharacterized protein n=1 Tax=Porcisia hertigi TaxID=2761500 RepID=A0A836LJR9_9TRYP|nr:hypothetical protein JKF63_07904 [Porcisia hertigi]
MTQTPVWIKECPAYAVKRIAAVKRDRMVIRELDDPTKFSVNGREKKYLCTIGNPHVCSCLSTQPCIHILSVLLLHYNVIEENPIIWQRYINEVELSDLIDKKKDRERCLFCRECMSNGCSCESCGARFHRMCLKLASRGRKGDSSTCPKCNETNFKSETKSITSCSNCKESCKARHYRCLLCPAFYLCGRCYRSSRNHPSHPFACCGEDSPSTSGGTVEFHNVGDLQYREINPEDYDVLLALDHDHRRPLGADEIRNLLTERFGARARMNDSCPVCLRGFTVSSMCTALPCGHVMHSGCGFKWLSEYSDACPIDNRKVRDRRTIQERETAGKAQAALQASSSDRMASPNLFQAGSLRFAAGRPRGRR